MTNADTSAPIIRASLYASCSPGGERHLTHVFALNLDDRSFWTELQQECEKKPNYYVLKIGRADLVFSPDATVSTMSEAAQRALNADLLARYLPQAWVNDYAIEIDGAVDFNALPAVIKAGREALRSAFDAGGDLDFLADDLEAAKAHSGPFEVDLHEESVVRMIRLLSSRGPMGAVDLYSFDTIDQMTWNAFANTAEAILKEQARVRAGDAAQVDALGNPYGHEVFATLMVAGNTFRFLNSAGGGRIMRAEWADGDTVDAPTQLAREVIEAHLLSCFHAGVIQGPGGSNTAFEQALHGTFERLGAVVERHQAAERSSPERPR